MNHHTLLATVTALFVFTSASLLAAEQVAKKLTCCQEAKAQKKACTHNCCIVAHRKGESCIRCNPGKEDLVVAQKKEAIGAKLASTDKAEKAKDEKAVKSDKTEKAAPVADKKKAG